jgi:hypothetical protein
LNLYKEGLKGFLLVCQENPSWMSQLEDKLEQYELEAENIAINGTDAEINSDSGARASQIAASWATVSVAIGQSFGTSSKPSLSANFGILKNFNHFTADLLIPNKYQSAIRSSLFGKNPPSNSNYQKRILLFGKLKVALRESFLEMVKGDAHQRDFCQCFDYTNLFRFVHSLTPQAAVTFGIPQTELGFEYDYTKAFEDNCRTDCGESIQSRACPNNGIEHQDGSCSYNFYMESSAVMTSFPMTYKQNEALKFTVTGGPVNLFMAQSSSTGSKTYIISISRTKTEVFLSTVGDGKSKISKGSSTVALKDGQSIWVTMYSNVLKVGLGSVGKKEILSIPMTGLSLFTPTVVGFVKTSTARTMVMNAKFSNCSGNGHMVIKALFKTPTCKCDPLYSGNFCETSLVESWIQNKPNPAGVKYSVQGKLNAGIIRR